LDKLIEELGLNQGGVQLYCDNHIVFYWEKHWIYFVVMFHKIKELIVTEEVFLEKVHTLDNATDILMKPIPKDKFKHCLHLVSICSL